MPNRRILFVDDDAMLLAGLQRSLRPMRKEWTMEFVDSGPAALEAMGALPVRRYRDRHAYAADDRGGTA